MADSNTETAQWLTRARAVAPVVEKWRALAAQQRQLPDELNRVLADAGMFRLSTPKSVGGAEVDEVTAVSIIEELSRQDGSVGWNVMVASNTAMIGGHLPHAAIQHIYRESSSAFIAGALLPKGNAEVAVDGYRLSGRWLMASGVHQADWMVACSMVTQAGSPRRLPDGSPEVRTFFLPAEHCEVLDTWNTIGMRGTGSHDWRVEDEPIAAAFSFPLQIAGERRSDALYVPDFASFAVARVAAVALGIARDAIDSFVALAQTKVPTVGSSKLASQHTVHEQVGRAEGLLRAGRSMLYETVRALPYDSRWSAPLTDDQRAAIRLAAAHAARNAAEAVDLMFNAAGTSAIYTGSRLGCCFCDVHVVTQHVNVAASNVEMVGQHLLGLGMHLRR